MQPSHHHFRGGDAFFSMQIHGNAAAVVDHGHGVVFVDDDVDLGAISGQGLIDGIVHDFVHQVMQTGFSGRTDVHSGTQAHGLEAFEHLDTSRIVRSR